VAYAIALALSVQLNFAVNQLLVWHDRPVAVAAFPLARRWLAFHALIALSLVVNFVAFAVAQAFVPDLVAAMVAVVASTALKFVSLDRVAFRAADRPRIRPRIRPVRRRTGC
jgi:putative flippase GtrA